jgi:hypothetical protein
VHLQQKSRLQQAGFAVAAAGLEVAVALVGESREAAGRTK